MPRNLISYPTMNSKAGRNLRVLVSLFAYNEGDKLRATLDQFPVERSYDALVVDDGSTDGSLAGSKLAGFVLTSKCNKEALGASIRKAFSYALDNGYDCIVIMAGNG